MRVLYPAKNNQIERRTIPRAEKRHPWLFSWKLCCRAIEVLSCTADVSKCLYDWKTSFKAISKNYPLSVPKLNVSQEYCIPLAVVGTGDTAFLRSKNDHDSMWWVWHDFYYRNFNLTTDFLDVREPYLEAPMHDRSYHYCPSGIGPGTPLVFDDLPRYLPARDDEYTTHRCIGGRPFEMNWNTGPLPPKTVVNPRRQLCSFRNMCLINGTFTYFRSQRNKIPWEYDAAGNRQQHLPERISMIGPDAFFSPREVIDQPIPAHVKRARPEPYIFMAPAAAEYLDAGLLLMDTFRIAAYLQMNFGMLTPQVHIVLNESCSQKAGPERRQCRQTLAFAGPAVSDFAVLSLDELAAAGDQCFDHLIVGVGDRYLSRRRAEHEYVYTAWRDLAYARFGLMPDYARRHLDRCRITIGYTSKARFANHETLVKYVRATTTCRVAALDVAAVSFQTLLAVMARTTVFVSQREASYAAMFLPDQTAAIIGDVCRVRLDEDSRSNATRHKCNPATNVCCERPFGWLLSSISFFKALYYQPSSTEAIDGAAYSIEFDIFDRLLSEALEVTGRTPTGSVADRTPFSSKRGFPSKPIKYTA
eukprot:TRINITY_DN244_c0_g3_i2.p1 TRINITY_DN244_c0_g3~~TRINITY_DN244_c0_g3_i2.p1  ORF type:complete len:587 (+),score=104.38 TRINITY_DN244_c0_g3_i2:126-1886(+)